MNIRLVRHICLLCFWACLIVLFPCASNAAERGKVKKMPTSVTADRMEYDADGQTVIFTGNVHVLRPDFELWSVKMTIYLDKSSKKSSGSEIGGAGGMQAGDIDHIVAEKDVRMKSNEREGSCQKATYYAKTDKVVMEGSPILKDKDKNSISGVVITHYLKANRSEVQRPMATFFTQDKTDNSLMPGGKPQGTRQ